MSGTHWDFSVMMAEVAGMEAVPLDLPSPVRAHAELSQKLGRLVAYHRWCEQSTAINDQAPAKPKRAGRAQRIEAARLEDALVRFQKSLERADEYFLPALIEPAPSRMSSRRWRHLLVITKTRLDDSKAAAAALRAALRVVRTIGVGTKGRPPDVRAYELAGDTAGILSDAGIPIMKTRGGVLDKVIREMFRAASIAAPDDMLPYLRSAVEYVRGQLRASSAK